MALFLTVHDIEVGFSQSPRTVTFQAEAVSSAIAWHWKILSVPEGSVARVGQHQDFVDGVATVQKNENILQPIPAPSPSTECTVVLNRGKNTGAGPIYIYWMSEGQTDLHGESYPDPPPLGVPFGQLVEILGAYYPVPQLSSCRFVINRGRNTGAGPEYIYWKSMGTTDQAGAHYPVPDPFDVPFSQLIDIMGSISGKEVSLAEYYNTYGSLAYGTDTFGG